MSEANDNPQTLQEWLERLHRHQAGIFVREKGSDGRFGPVALADLPSDLWAKHVARWLEDGAIPVRVRTPDEVAKATGATP